MNNYDPITKYFSYELDLIRNNRLREFTQDMLYMLPKYFWDIPSTQSGRFSPLYSNKPHGLVFNVKASIMLASELMDLNMFNMTLNESYLVYSALLLKDGVKYGMDDISPDQYHKAYVRKCHPILMAEFLRNHRSSAIDISDDDFNKIISAVQSHSGQWSSYDDYPSNEYVPSNGKMPTPNSVTDFVVHLSDYLASRKFMNIMSMPEEE